MLFAALTNHTRTASNTHIFYILGNAIIFMNSATLFHSRLFMILMTPNQCSLVWLREQTCRILVLSVRVGELGSAKETRLLICVVIAVRGYLFHLGLISIGVVYELNVYCFIFGVNMNVFIRKNSRSSAWSGLFHVLNIDVVFSHH